MTEEQIPKKEIEIKEDDFKDKIDLGSLIDTNEIEIFEERKKEVMNKVRLVIQGVNEARNLVSKKRKELIEIEKTYERGLNKLDQLRKGNWNILEEKKEEKKQDLKLD